MACIPNSSLVWDVCVLASFYESWARVFTVEATLDQDKEVWLTETTNIRVCFGREFWSIDCRTSWFLLKGQDIRRCNFTAIDATF